MSNTKMCRVEHGRMIEIQSEIIETAQKLNGLVAGLMQIAGDMPGGLLLDVPGTKPRAKVRERWQKAMIALAKDEATQQLIEEEGGQ